MKTVGSIRLETACVLLLAAATTILAAAPGFAQTMGEYGATVAEAGGFGPSASSLAPPESYVNPVGDSKSATMIEVRNNRDDRDDSYAAHEKPHRSESNGADEWSQVP